MKPSRLQTVLLGARRKAKVSNDGTPPSDILTPVVLVTTVAYGPGLSLLR